MATATKAKTAPRVKIVAMRVGPNARGMSITTGWSRTVPATETEPSYRKHFEPGVPTVLNAREIDACVEDLANGRLVECEASPEHVLQLLESIVDVERDRQIQHLRFVVNELVGELKSTGMFRQAQIDAIIAGEGASAVA